MLPRRLLLLLLTLLLLLLTLLLLAAGPSAGDGEDEEDEDEEEEEDEDDTSSESLWMMSESVRSDWLMNLASTRCCPTEAVILAFSLPARSTSESVAMRVAASGLDVVSVKEAEAQAGGGGISAGRDSTTMRKSVCARLLFSFMSVCDTCRCPSPLASRARTSWALPTTTSRVPVTTVPCGVDCILISASYAELLLDAPSRSRMHSLYTSRKDTRKVNCRSGMALALAKRALMASWMMPGLAAEPLIVCVLPDEVWPYASTLPWKPSSVRCTMPSQRPSKTSEVVELGGYRKSNA